MQLNDRENEVQPEWPTWKRLLFRFGFAYFLLSAFPFPLDLMFPDSEFVESLNNVWDLPVEWLARAFHVDASVHPNGSGDTTYNWLQLVFLLIASLLIAAVWSWFARGKGYDRLYTFFRAFLRFNLAFTLWLYGVAKLFPSQFPPPTLDRLLQPIGDASPMGLLWTFMGASAAYGVFCGAGEVLGGLLLTTRRTALAGALVSAGVLANVVMLNFAYDVPVKIYSTHLLAMALVIAAPDAGRLFRFFFLHRSIEVAPLPRLTRAPWLEWCGRLIRSAVVLWLAVGNVNQLVRSWTATPSLADRAPFYGIWSVDHQLSTGTAANWRRLIFDRRTMVSIQLLDDSRQRYNAKWVETNHSLDLSRLSEPGFKAELHYNSPSPSDLTVDGAFGGQAVHVVAHRTAIPAFRLTTRGFHWINEYPFNR